MGFDQLSPIAPTRVRCLLLPCGKITIEAFATAVQKLQKENCVRLADVNPEHGSKRSMFSPSTYPIGSVLLEYSTSDAAETSKRLAPFELYRRPLIILGIADGSASEELSGERETQITDLGNQLDQIKENHGSALLHKVLLFESPEEDIQDKDHIIRVPSQGTAPTTALKTIICELVAEFLEELSFYARSIQALPNIETPLSQPSVPSYGNAEDTGSRTVSPRPNSGNQSPVGASRENARSPYRASMPAHVLSPLSAEMTNGSSSSVSLSPIEASKPATTFDDMAVDRPSSSSSNRHARQVSVQGFGSGTTSEKARNQAKGRIGIVVGSMYLLAGRWTEAIRELTESAVTAKWSNDHAWFAKALDNILVGLLMCGWAGIDIEIPPICYPGEKPPWSFRSNKNHEGNRTAMLRILAQLLPDLTNQVLYYYGRAVSSSYTEKSAVPMLTFSESALRFARLLSILRFHYSALNELAFESIITNNVAFTVSVPDTIDGLATRAEIATIALKATPVHGGDDVLEPMDRLTVLAGLASILSSLGYHRKKAFLLRDFMTILLPLLIQSRKDSAAEMGFHPAASLSSAELAIESLNVPAIATQLGATDSDILTFLDSVCEIYGVVSIKDSHLRNRKEDGTLELSTDTLSDAIVWQSSRRKYSNTVLKMDVLRWCINICEALPDLPGMLRYSSDLLATASTGLAPGPDSSDAYPAMSVEDQSRSVNTIVRAARASEQLGLQDQEADYWDEFLIRDIEVVAASIKNPPIARRKQELLVVAEADGEKKSGPFIYNPFSNKPTTAANEPTLLLQSESTFVVLLQNLFDVELEIEWLKLETTNDAIDATVQGVTIGPYRTQKIHVKGKPTILGSTKIIGCTVKVKGCKLKTFSIFKAPWRPTEVLKLKQFGIEAVLQSFRRPMSASSEALKDEIARLDKPKAMTYPLNVIENQPLVMLRGSTLTQSAAMVLVGQTKKFKITLENTSDKQIDFLMVSFTDSTSEILRGTIDNRESSPADIYEAEYSAYHRPAFKLAESSSGELQIKPNGRLVLDIEVFGKPGLQNGTVQISYAHLGVPRNQVADKFYIRQILMPVVVTVNASVDLIRTEILPYSNLISSSSSSLSQSQPNTPAMVLSPTTPTKRQLDDVLAELKRQKLGEERCFILLDFFNAWPKPLRISLEANDSDDDDDWDKAYEVQDIIQPGNSARLLMIVPKMSIEDSQAPIPTINPANKRQFVLSTNRISAEIEKTGREVFWYREEVFKNLRATWSEFGGTSGQISLRSMRLSPRMIELLKPDSIQMDITVKSTEHDVGEISASHYTAQVDSFVTVTIQLRNRGPNPILPVLRIQPSLRNQPYNVALDLSRKLAFNGLLQRVLPRMEPDSLFEAHLGMVFLCTGEYEISASLEELRVQTDMNVSGIKGDPEDRHVWYSKRPCLIDVV